MILGGTEVAWFAFGAGVIVAKLLKEKYTVQAKVEAEKKLIEAKAAAERKAAEEEYLRRTEPERRKKEEEDRVRREKEYAERARVIQEEAEREAAEARARAEEARKSAIPFSDFVEVGYHCPKCGKAWRHSKKSLPQACNCEKCTGTHFHLNCTSGTYYGNVDGCMAEFIMLAKDNSSK